MIRFKVGETQITAELLSRTVTPSPHTAKELFEIEVRFAALARQRDKVQAALAIGEGMLLSGDQEPYEEVPITLQQKQYSYTEGLSEQTYIWTLVERETLTLDALQLADIVLKPYKVEYSFDGRSLIITSRVELDETTRKALQALPLYFPVIRRGVSDEARSMRFGQTVWAEIEGGGTRSQLVLVEETFDKERHGRGFLEPQFGNTMDSLATTNARLHKLFEVLKSKGVFTAEEIEQIVMVSDEEHRGQKERFDQVDDLDAYLGN